MTGQGDHRMARTGNPGHGPRVLWVSDSSAADSFDGHDTRGDRRMPRRPKHDPTPVEDVPVIEDLTPRRETDQSSGRTTGCAP